jgi:hypothetical protein
MGLGESKTRKIYLIYTIDTHQNTSVSAYWNDNGGPAWELSRRSNERGTTSSENSQVQSKYARCGTKPTQLLRRGSRCGLLSVTPCACATATAKERRTDAATHKHHHNNFSANKKVCCTFIFGHFSQLLPTANYLMTDVRTSRWHQHSLTE